MGAINYGKTVAVVVLMAAGLSSCGKSAHEKELEARVIVLERQVAEQQDQLGAAKALAGLDDLFRREALNNQRAKSEALVKALREASR